MRHLQKSGIVTLQALGGPIGSRTAPVQEGVSPKDMDKIKAAVEASTSFMNVGMHLKKAGLRYTFATSPMAIYIVQPTPNNRVAIVNKRYASDPDFVHGEIAVGIMESVNENTINEGISKDAIVRTLTSDKNAYYLSKDGNDWILDITPKAAQQSTFHQKFNVKDMGKGHLGMKYKISEDIETVANGLPQTMGKQKSLKREALKSIVREVMQEEAEYQKFFQKVLDKAGKSIPSMSDDEKKAFFNKVDAAWKAKSEGK
jgi:hypothetical protein